MKIKHILNIERSSEKIVLTIPEERLEQVKGYQFSSPVQINGEIHNHAGAVVLTLHIEFSLLVTCDRCLKETEQAFSYDKEHMVVRSVNDENNEEDYVIAEAESIDIAEIALADLLLELPSKMLCKEDCKGLCPVCGCDRNLTECNCGGRIEFT